MTLNKTVAVIGGAGRIGFPICLSYALAGLNVIGIDIDEKLCKKIMDGVLPFKENEGGNALNKVLLNGNFQMSTNIDKVRLADYIVILVGTPLDDYLKPNMDSFNQIMGDISARLNTNQVIIIRSTVTPGTTDVWKNKLNSITNMQEGLDYHLLYIPERASEGNVLLEVNHETYLIGCYSDESMQVAEDFLNLSVEDPKTIRLTPTEAEIAKLATNMSLYVQHAFANELYMICDSLQNMIGHSIDTNLIVEAVRSNPRAQMSSPGLNTGGPCLHKDGFYLTNFLDGPSLINTAFTINTGLPKKIAKDIFARLGPCRVSLLGQAFKAGSDDLRYSSGPMMSDMLKNMGCVVDVVEPNLPVGEYNKGLNAICGSDVVVLVTPHEEFKNLKKIQSIVKNTECLYVDVWGFWKDLKSVCQV